MKEQMNLCSGEETCHLQKRQLDTLIEKVEQLEVKLSAGDQIHLNFYSLFYHQD